jgi:hypothetical protein
MFYMRAYFFKRPSTAQEASEPEALAKEPELTSEPEALAKESESSLTLQALTRAP